MLDLHQWGFWNVRVTFGALLGPGTQFIQLMILGKTELELKEGQVWKPRQADGPRLRSGEEGRPWGGGWQCESVWV